MEPKPRDVSSQEDGIQARTTRPLTQEDLPAIRPILETWLRDAMTREVVTEEVVETLQNMHNSLTPGNPRSFFVAELGGRVVGVMGMQPPGEKMGQFIEGCVNPVELVNAYVASDARQGKGIGSSLVRRVEFEARRQGYTDIVLNSGVRYQQTAWGFYDRLPGYQTLGISENHYGPDIHAKVWRKNLRGQ